jgi:D-threo-aldose 1-dehydrogenase
MKANQLRQIGKTSLHVTQFGLGGTTLGNIYSAVEEPAALDTIDAAYQAGMRYFDTAPLYGYGLSEMRLGKGIARYPRDQVVISTKVGWALVPLEPGQPQAIDIFAKALPFRGVIDYSRAAILRSIEESLKRMNTDRIDILLMHDPDEAVSIKPGRDPYEVSHFAQAMKEAYPILDDLRRQGVIKAIGVGMNQWQMLHDFAQAGDFDCFLLAGRYTLLEQEPMNKFLPLCEKKKISVIIGGPYNSGILATGAVEGAYYNYQPAPPRMLVWVRQIEEVCARHKVALQAAALQFPFGHPAVTSIIPGARSVAELHANLAYVQQQIPADFWAELKSLGLIDPTAPVPTDRTPDEREK